MSPPAPLCTTPPADASDARQRLLLAGLQLFAQQGFAGTTTRELAQAAGVNVAAISYYFGDKVGLYRAAFFEPLGDVSPGLSVDTAGFDCASVPLDAALRAYYAGFIAPLALGDTGRLCVKLRMREMVEPTGLWDQEVHHAIKPMHDALVVRLCAHLGLAAADDALHRLVVCLAALGVHLHLGRDVTDAVAPQLNQAADAPQQWADCLLQNGLAMVEQERQRRAALASANGSAGVSISTPASTSASTPSSTPAAAPAEMAAAHAAAARRPVRARTKAHKA